MSVNAKLEDAEIKRRSNTTTDGASTSASQAIPIPPNSPRDMPSKGKMAFKKVNEESKRKAAPYGRAKGAIKASIMGGEEDGEDETCTI